MLWLVLFLPACSTPGPPEPTVAELIQPVVTPLQLMFLHAALICRQLQDIANAARWNCWAQNSALRESDTDLSRLRAGQGMLGSREIEPAIAA